MSLDLAVLAGSPRKPACVFVHGLGMSKHIWTAPEEARVLGGMARVTVLLRGYEHLDTLYHDLAARGFTVMAWSQSRPVGPAEAALEELTRVVREARKRKPAGIVLIGHSRGGLLARRYLQDHESADVRALVTLCSPHRGSTMARWAGYVSPLASLLRPAMPAGREGTLVGAMRRTLLFLESTAVRELLPGSDFLRSLKEQGPPGLYALSVGGTSPVLFSVPGLSSLPAALGRILPDRAVPEEMRRGMGDGLVSAKSAVLPFAREHLNFPLNHAAVIVDRVVRDAVLERILRECS
jgi:pimeloyl-ACP methyl ester carboxylesterase